MNSNEETQPEPAAYELADFGDRALARVVDGFLMACIVFMMWFAVGVVMIWFFLFEDSDGATALLLLLVVAAMVPAVLYEVNLTVRRGCAVGKEIADVLVIRWSAYNDTASHQPFPSFSQSLIRWLIPHGVLFAGLAVLWLWSLSHDPDNMNPLFLFLGPVGWILMYLTSLLDTNRRGWHDKLADTIVVKAPHPDPSVSRDGSVSTGSGGHGSMPNNPQASLTSSASASANVARGAPLDEVDRWDTNAGTAIVAFVSKLMGRSKTDPESPEPRGEREDTDHS